jgi:hypothetical protein
MLSPFSLILLIALLQNYERIGAQNSTTLVVALIQQFKILISSSLSILSGDKTERTEFLVRCPHNMMIIVIVDKNAFQNSEFPFFTVTPGVISLSTFAE